MRQLPFSLRALEFVHHITPHQTEQLHLSSLPQSESSPTERTEEERNKLNLVQLHNTTHSTLHSSKRTTPKVVLFGLLLLRCQCADSPPICCFEGLEGFPQLLVVTSQTRQSDPSPSSRKRSRCSKNPWANSASKATSCCCCYLVFVVDDVMGIHFAGAMWLHS